MSDDDDDFDEYLDCGDEAEVNERIGLGLVVPARVPKAEMLNQFEEQFRRVGCPPVMFLEQEVEDGPYVLGNAAEFAERMKLPPGTPVTEEMADAWIDTQPSLSWEW